MRLRPLWLGLLGSAAGACVLDYDGLTGGALDGSVRGPAQVFISTPAPGFFVDATEVTCRDYRAFLEDKAGSTTGQRPACAWNTSFIPKSWPPADAELDLPVVQVDWCDAVAYCAWAGKRLCGAATGGSLGWTSVNDPSVDAWYAACSRGGALAYPYGDAFESAACASARASIAVVKSLATCEGGYPGLFDLSGNAREWTDACDGDTGAQDGCRVRGGGFDDSSSEPGRLACLARAGDVDAEYRDTQNEWTGFRCCRP